MVSRSMVGRAVGCPGASEPLRLLQCGIDQRDLHLTTGRAGPS